MDRHAHPQGLGIVVLGHPGTVTKESRLGAAQAKPQQASRTLEIDASDGEREA